MLFTYFDMLPTGVERHDKLLDSCFDGLAEAVEVGEAHTLVPGQARWFRCMARVPREAVSWRRTQFISRWRMARVGAW